MHKNKQNTIIFLCLALCLALFFITNISFGSVKIPLTEVFSSLTGNGASKKSWEYIILNYRLPKAITAILAGTGLAISGLLMQTLFRNPLAGPYVLGLNSGASLGVAFIILGAGLLPGFLSPLLLSSYGIVIASALGSFAVLLLVLFVSQKLRDTMSILIVGLMFGSFAGAIVGVFSYFSTAQALQKYTFWAMGSLGNLPWKDITILFCACLIGIILGILCIKPLDALLLGERYAKSLGINFNRARLLIIFSTSILAGSITAFAGPIAFVGLAVPHIAKLVFRTGSHAVLFWATLLIGGIIMLLCDTITQLPGTDFVLPVNAITSIIGAPVVIWLLLHRRKGVF